MSSQTDAQTAAIREMVCGLSDDELRSMLRATPPKHTRFALQVAQKELSRRSTMRSLGSDVSQPGGSTSTCYLEVWSQKNFQGEYLRIEGPAELSALDFTRLDWRNTISSLRVGPATFVLAFDERDFRGAMASFGPGEEIADLEVLSFDDQIDSLKLVNSLKIFDSLRLESENQTTVDPSLRTRKKKKRGHKRSSG